MPIYEYNGVHYDIDTTDQAEAKRKILANLPPASAADKFMESFKDVSVSDWAQKSLLAPMLQTMQAVTPFGMLRPDLARQNLQQGSQNLVGKGQQMAQGVANIVTNPVESAQKAYTAVTENPAGVAGEMAKGILYDPEMLIGSGLGNVVEKGAMSAGRGVKGAVQAPINFGRGFTEGYFNPQGARPGVSATVPLKEKYYPATTAEQFTAGKIGLPELEASQVPSASLFNTPALQKGLDIASKNELGQPMIPLQGRKMEAFGEQLGREYANKPLAGAIDILGAIGGVATTGVPLTPSAAMRAYQGYKTRQLGQAANFNPEFPQKLAQAQGRAGIQGQMPQTPLLTNNPSAPGPVNPATMYVAPEGVAGTNINQVSQAGAMAKYPPQPVAQTPQQMALQKTQEIVSGKTTPAITQETRAKASDIAEQIRQRNLAQQQQSWQQRAGVTLPTNEAPVAGPVAPTPQAPSALTKLKESINENPPAQMTAIDEATARAEMAKQQAQITPEYRGTIVKEWVKGNQLVEGVPIDTSKKAYNGSNLTRSQAQKLMSIHIDSIPVIEGATPAQTINAMVTHLEKNNPGIFKTSKKKGPSNVSQMLIREELPSGISSISKEVIGDIYPNKAAYDKAMVFKTLQENVPTASYMEGDKLITMTPQNIPKDLMRSAGISPLSKTVRDVKTGKVIKD